MSSENTFLYRKILYDQLLFAYVCLSESCYKILGKMTPIVIKTLSLKVPRLKEQG